MRYPLHLSLTVGLLFCVQAIAAQDGGYSMQPLTDHIYELSYPVEGYLGKVIASVGEDGILLVDTGDKQKAEALKAKLQELWHGEPKVIILSHEHIEHVGGNEIFGTAPVVIGHTSLRSVLKSRYFLFEEYTGATLPEITFSDSLSLFFNGEEIKLISVAGGHSGSDIIVWFTRSGVACVAALCNWPHYPSIDNTTGDVNKYPGAVKRVIDMLPEGTKVISGHGSDCTMAEFRQFHDMLTQTSDIVKRGLAHGKTMQALQQEDALKEFRKYDGSYTSTNDWIAYLAKGIQGAPKDTRKLLYDPIYYALKDGGADAAVITYDSLKRDHPDDYLFDDKTLPLIGYMLYGKGRYAEAVGLLKLGLRDYSTGEYAGLSYKVLGRICEKTNDTAQAVINYRKLLELEPADTATAARIRKLERK